MWTWQEKGGLQHLHITLALFSKNVHEGDGVKNVQKSVHMVYD